MGKAALLAISAFVVMGAFYGLGSQSQLLATQQRVADYEYSVMSQNAAVTGYNLAKQHLTGSFTTKALAGTFEGAFYTTNAKVISSDEATITSIGTYDVPDGEPVHYYVYAKVKRKEVVGGGPVPSEAPKFFNYALITQEDLTLNGNVSIDTVRVAGSQGVVYNANIHTNGELQVTGKVSVRGYGTHRLSRSLSPNKPERFFMPYDTESREPVVKQISQEIPIPLATTTPAMLNSMFAPDITTGSVTINSNKDFKALGATRDNPYVWYVDGSLEFKGNVKTTGYVIFLVRDDIVINGNVSIATGEGPAENTLGLYACRDISIHGNPDVIWGQIFAKRDFTFGGTPKIKGNIIVGRYAKLNGTPDINYYPPSPALTRYWEKPQFVLELVNYSEKTS